MTTVRDVIAKCWDDKGALGEQNADVILRALLSAPDLEPHPELAAKLNPWRSKQEIALSDIAGIAAAAEQDISEVERWWPPARRGSNANRAHERMIARIRAIAQTARNSLPAPPSEDK